MALIDFTIKSGDLLPKFQATLKDANGAVNISTASSVRLLLTNAATGALKVNALATNLDDGSTAKRGQVEYAWTGTDTDTLGIYLAEWEVMFGSAPITFPADPLKPYLLVLIVADLN